MEKTIFKLNILLDISETKGYYVLLNVTATPEAIKEFERVANIKENIIRYITVAE